LADRGDGSRKGASTNRPRSTRDSSDDVTARGFTTR
jgi:hypothetical protein